MKPEEPIRVHRQRLGEWLEAWQMHLSLEALEDLPEAEAPRLAPQAYAPGRFTAAGAAALRIGHPDHLIAGAIVLLPPENGATRARPVYVALVEAVCDGRWLVVPFGRFPVPALPGELATGRAAPPLQVLCVWNAAPVEAERLARGWQVGRLNWREKRWLRQLLDLPPGAPPTRALALRLGPPLVHPLDPRHDYIEQERMLWLADESPSRCGESPDPYRTEGGESLPQAAEKRDETYRNRR